MSERPIEDYDDPRVAAEYAITLALSTGDGILLRSIKALMDAAKANSTSGAASPESEASDACV